MAFDTTRYGFTPEQAIAWMRANPAEVPAAAAEIGMTPADIIDVAQQAGYDTTGYTPERVATEFGMPAPAPVERVTAVSPAPPAAQTVRAVSPAPPAAAQPVRAVSAAPPADIRAPDPVPTTFANIQDYMAFYGLTDEDMRRQLSQVSPQQAIEGFRTSGIQDLGGTVDYVNQLLGTGYGNQMLDPTLTERAPATFNTIQDYMAYYGLNDAEMRAQLQGLSQEDIQRQFQLSGIQDLAGTTDYINRLMGTTYTPAAIDPTTADIFQPGLVPESVSRTGLPAEFTGPLLEGLLPQLRARSAPHEYRDARIVGKPTRRGGLEMRGPSKVWCAKATTLVLATLLAIIFTLATIFKKCWGIISKMVVCS